MSGIATGIIGLGTAIFGAVQSGKAKREAQQRQRAEAAKVAALEANRQDPIDPYADLANPYANLQIATQAAEIQAEQQDISLASTLDTLRATGASAGGATALARAASQSKRGVSASIEQQEVQNERLRAQGELQTAQMRGQGEMFKYQATEAREMQELNRAASAEQAAQQSAAAYKGQETAAWGQAVGAAAGMGVDAVRGEGMFKVDPARQATRQARRQARGAYEGFTSAERKSWGDIGINRRDFITGDYFNQQSNFWSGTGGKAYQDYLGSFTTVN